MKPAPKVMLLQVDELLMHRKRPVPARLNQGEHGEEILARTYRGRL